MNYDKVKDELQDIYLTPYCRLQPYVMGLVLGYVLYVHFSKETKLPWVTFVTSLYSQRLYSQPTAGLSGEKWQAVGSIYVQCMKMITQTKGEAEHGGDEASLGTFQSPHTRLLMRLRVKKRVRDLGMTPEKVSTAILFGFTLWVFWGT